MNEPIKLLTLTEIARRIGRDYRTLRNIPVTPAAVVEVTGREIPLFIPEQIEEFNTEEK